MIFEPEIKHTRSGLMMRWQQSCEILVYTDNNWERDKSQGSRKFPASLLDKYIANIFFMFFSKNHV